MNRKKAVRLLWLIGILAVLCVVGIVLLFLKEKQSSSPSFSEDESIESLHTTIVDEEKKKQGMKDGEQALWDEEEDVQYIIDDIGMEAYLQLSNPEPPDTYYDTSEADKVIARYYRRKKMKPQPVPEVTTEGSGTTEVQEEDATEVEGEVESE